MIEFTEHLDHDITQIRMLRMINSLKREVLESIAGLYNLHSTRKYLLVLCLGKLKFTFFEKPIALKTNDARGADYVCPKFATSKRPIVTYTGNSITKHHKI